MSAVLLATAAAIAAIAMFVATSLQSELYMDELFHIPQAQAYCRGEFDTWDPKITTLPGLYFLALPFTIVRRAFVPDLGEACSDLGIFRAVSAFFHVGIVFLAAAISRELHPGGNPTWTAAVAALWPPLAFSGFLFYTDTAGMFWVLLCWLAVLRGHRVAGALAGAVAVLVRQTNIVWMAFVAGASAVQFLQAHVQRARDKRERDDAVVVPAGGDDEKSGDDAGAGAGTGAGADAAAVAAASSLPVWLLLWEGRAQLPALVARYWAFVVVFLAFTVFLALNGGVVVGDRAHHRPVLHYAQLGYALLATAASLWPLWVSAPLHAMRDALAAAGAVCGPRQCMRTDARSRGGRSRGARVGAVGTQAAMVVGLVGFAALGLWVGSLEHPFLLADNRHYMFYIWGRTLGRWKWLRPALAPVYVLAAALLGGRLSRDSRSRAVADVFVLATALTVVPAHLLEPRYFAIPAVLGILQVRWSRVQAGLAAAVSAAVHLVTVFVFVARPFVWGNGSVARFMW